MKQRTNISLNSLSLLSALGAFIWYIVGDVSISLVLTVLIVVIALMEIVSLILVGKVYPESYVQFKIGLIVGLFVLLGLKAMYPSSFVPLTITVLAINFLYNFYAHTKHKKGAFKRRRGKKLQF